MELTPSTNYTLPVGGGSDYCETVTIIGSKERVEKMIASINLYVRNTLHAEMLESQIPTSSKPSPCKGCGN